MTLILRWIINAITLLAITQIFAGFEVQSFYFALVAALIIGLLNAVIRPILIVLTLPINIITLGLFIFAINAFIIWFVSTFVQGFTIDNFLVALGAAIILWSVSVITNWLIKQTKRV
ncbi:phage holin family protein [Patescibacteria group bacterium]|nr:phage holin family protein [Patescibacteria group bacterium]